MTEILDFLENYSGAITALATLVLVVTTIVYAVLTGILARENKILRRAGTEPELVAYLIPDRRYKTFLNFVIANIGQGPALDVEFRIIADADDFARHEVQLAERGMRRRIGVLPQGERLSTFFGSGPDLFGDEPLKPFSVAVRHRYSNREAVFHLNIDDFRGLITLGIPSDHEIAEALKNIERHLRHWTSGFQRLRVETISSEDAAAQQREAFDRLKTQQRAASGGAAEETSPTKE